jgi:hypothetical protein
MQFINISKNKVLDVQGGKDEEGHKVQVWTSNKSAAQKWEVIYLDKAEKVQSEGLNTEFGFHINRPFYIQSKLPFRRVAEAHGNNHVYLRRWVKNKKQQRFKFNGVDKTIRSEHWTNYCLEIPGNGAHNNLKITSGINSRWW